MDGWAWHVDAERFTTDRRKQNALVRAGWDPLRFTWHDLDGRPGEVVAEICATRRRRPVTGVTAHDAIRASDPIRDVMPPDPAIKRRMRVRRGGAAAGMRSCRGRAVSVVEVEVAVPGARAEVGAQAAGAQALQLLGGGLGGLAGRVDDLAVGARACRQVRGAGLLGPRRRAEGRAAAAGQAGVAQHDVAAALVR